jgi:hypothetical protein
MFPTYPDLAGRTALVTGASSHCTGQDLCISGGALLVVPRGQMRPV